jgi:pimeloyl-ACP methyl ester carboxylesterase
MKLAASRRIVDHLAPVRHWLTVTSAGLPVADLAGMDWRPNYKREYPGAAARVMSVREDWSAELLAIDKPTLLLWGGADSISPPGGRVAFGYAFTKGAPACRAR